MIICPILSLVKWGGIYYTLVMDNDKFYASIAGSLKSAGITGGGIVVGLSGGADSVALLHALNSLKSALRLKIYAAHLNHGIRGDEADDDERYCAELCAGLGIELLCEKTDVPAYRELSGKTLEQAARDVRYVFLRRAKAHFNADYIAVAHHMNDNAESILLHLIRGSGLSGLTGMELKRGDIIRPLLHLKRRDIEEYVNVNGLDYRTDSTNLVADGSRNVLRLMLVPTIEERLNPKFTESLVSTAELLSEDEAFLTETAQNALLSAKRDGGYDRAVLSKLARPIKSRAIRLALAASGVDTDVERKHIDEICRLLSAKTGASLDIPHTSVHISNELICFGKRTLPESYSLPMNIGGKTITPCGTVYAELAEGAPPAKRQPDAFYLDASVTGTELTVRSRQSGDRFHPLGAPGTKKLKDWMIDKKLPRDARNVPLVCRGNEIFCVLGHTVSEKVRVTKKTSAYLKISFDKNEHLL